MHPVPALQGAGEQVHGPRGARAAAGAELAGRRAWVRHQRRASARFSTRAACSAMPLIARSLPRPCQVDTKKSYHCSAECLREHWAFHRDFHQQSRENGAAGWRRAAQGGRMLVRQPALHIRCCPRTLRLPTPSAARPRHPHPAARRRRLRRCPVQARRSPSRASTPSRAPTPTGGGRRQLAARVSGGTAAPGMRHAALPGRCTRPCAPAPAPPARSVAPQQLWRDVGGGGARACVRAGRGRRGRDPQVRVHGL